MAKLKLLLSSTLALAGCLDPNAPGILVGPTVAEDPTLPRVEVHGTTLPGEP